MQDPVLYEVLKNQGRLEAKLDMLLEMEMNEDKCDDGDGNDSEDVADAQSDVAAPVTYSNQLEMPDLPPIF